MTHEGNADVGARSFDHAEDAFGEAARVDRFRKKRQLLAELERSLIGKPVILFKGSRSMKLEQIIQGLTGPQVVSH